MSGATFEPTPRRLAKARREGDFGASGAPGAALGLLLVALALPLAAEALAERSAVDLREALAHAGDRAPAAELEASRIARPVLLFAGPLLSLLAVSALVVTGLETRFGLAFGRLLGRSGSPAVSPAAGFRKSVFPFVALALLGALVASELPSMLHVTGRDPEGIARATRLLASEVLRAGALLAVAWALVEALLAGAAHRARLRMTHAEVARERRESEGDPAARAARKRAAEELLGATPLSSAALVVAGHRVSVALAWDREDKDAAPRVIAAGRGDAATALEDEARRHGIPRVHDATLAEALASLPQDLPLPEALYEPVAEALIAAEPP